LGLKTPRMGNNHLETRLKPAVLPKIFSTRQPLKGFMRIYPSECAIRTISRIIFWYS
jgi:hypothetical protein